MHSDPGTAAKVLQRPISAIRGGKRYIAYGEGHEVTAEMATIAEDIRIDILPRDPETELALAEKLLCLDQVIFERTDDSDGLIGDELRAACVLWLDAAAAVRAKNADSATDWPAVVYDLYQGNDYGVREPLLEQAQRLLREEELRALAARFEDDSRATMDAARAGTTERHHVFGHSSAMGLVARALSDPKLYEQSILTHSPQPNALQANNIAEHYLACGDATGALRWLKGDSAQDAQFERLDLLDRAYGGRSTPGGCEPSDLQARRAAGRSAELHIYQRGGHGFGMNPTHGSADYWIDEFYWWLQSTGILTTK